MNKWVDAVLWLIAAAIVAGAVAHPPKAHASCDPRYDACQVPRWCETTGTLIPPLTGYCPLGPDNYAPPWTGSDG